MSCFSHLFHFITKFLSPFSFHSEVYHHIPYNQRSSSIYFFHHITRCLKLKRMRIVVMKRLTAWTWPTGMFLYKNAFILIWGYGQDRQTWYQKLVPTTGKNFTHMLTFHFLLLFKLYFQICCDWCWLPDDFAGRLSPPHIPPAGCSHPEMRFVKKSHSSRFSDQNFTPK